MLKRLVKMTAGHGVGYWASPLLSLIFTPIITRILSPGDYGIADYFASVGLALRSLTLLAMPQAVAGHFNDQPDMAWRRQITGSALTLVLLSGTLCGGIVFILAPWLARLTPVTYEYAHLFRILGATLVFGLGSPLVVNVAQLALQARWMLWLSLTQLAFLAIGNTLFIILLRWGVTGMVLVPIAVYVTTSLVGVALMRPLIGRPNLRISRLLLRTGATLVPAAMAGWALQVADRLIMAQYVSAEELGYYSIATRVANLLFVAITPLFASYTSLALSIQHDPAARQRYATAARYLTALVLLGGLGLGLFAREILTLLTHAAYVPAAVYVGFLTYLHAFGAMYNILYIGGMAGKEFGKLSAALLLSAVINISLCFILVPPYHVWGVTAASFISSAALPIALYLWLKKRYPVPYPVVKIGLAVLVQFTLLLVGVFIPPLPLPTSIGLKLVIWLVLPLAYLLIGMVTWPEMQQSWHLARRYLPVSRN